MKLSFSKLPKSVQVGVKVCAVPVVIVVGIVGLGALFARDVLFGEPAASDMSHGPL